MVLALALLLLLASIPQGRVAVAAAQEAVRPTIGAVEPQTIPLGMGRWIDFEVNAAGRPLASLTFTATSGTPDLLPQEHLKLHISEARQAVFVRHVGGAEVTTYVTLSISDGTFTDWRRITVSARKIPDVLILEPMLANLEIPAGAWVSKSFLSVPADFWVDPTFSATTSDPRLQVELQRSTSSSVRYGSGDFTESNATHHYRYRFNAKAGLLGPVSVTFTIADKRTVWERTVIIFVSQKDRPVIEPVADQVIDQDTSLTVPVHLAHPTLPADQLRFDAAIPFLFREAYLDGSVSADVKVTGAGAERQVTITPPKGWWGHFRVYMTVRYAGSVEEASFTVTVRPKVVPYVMDLITETQGGTDSQQPPEFLGHGLVFSIPFRVVHHHGERPQMRVEIANPGLFAGTQIHPGTAGSDGGERWHVNFFPLANRYGTSEVTLTATSPDLTLTRTFIVKVLPVNKPPSFFPGPDQSVVRTAGRQVVPRWATAVSAGPAEEEQSVAFQVAVDRPELFAQAPAITPDGTLTYTPAAAGQARVTVQLIDDGGTERGGLNRSAAVTFAITITEPAPAFGDVPPSHWAFTATAHLQARGVALPPDRFDPDAPVTRATVADWLSQAFGLEPDPSFAHFFTDIAPGDPQAGAIGALVRAGVMTGDAPATFRPAAPITRQELALVLTRMLRYLAVEPPMEADGAALFAALQDQDAIAPWAVDGVRFMVERGLIKGRPGPSFAPTALTTRAEAAVLIHRLAGLPGQK